MAACSSDVVFISKHQNFFSKVFTEMSTLRNQADFTDLQLKSGDKVVNCHRVVISANSPKLKRVLRLKMKEAVNGQLELTEVPSDLMNILIEYMYSGEMSIDKENLIHMIQAADSLGMLELRDLCVEKAAEFITSNNCMRWLHLATNIHHEDLMLLCGDIFVTQFNEIWQSKEFLQLSYTEINSFITTYARRIESNYVHAGVQQWVAFKRDRREFCQKLLNIIPDNANQKSDIEINPRLVLLGGHQNNQCWEFNPPSGLRKIAELPEKYLIHGTSFCAMPNGFALTGGQNSKGCMQFSIQNGKWLEMRDMLQARYSHSSVYCRGCIWVFGGFIDGQESKSVQYLDVKTERWHEAPDLPNAVQHPEVITYKKEVYLFYPCDNRLIRLNLDNKVQREMSPMPGNSAIGARMIQAGDLICVAGGRNKVNSWYKPSTNIWSQESKPALDHCFPGVLYKDNRIFIIGGMMQSKIESFDIEKKVWSISDFQMPSCIMLLKGLMIES